MGNFHQLLRDVRRISIELLPQVSPVSRYTDSEVLRILSFRLFAHAEIEGFIEALAENAVDSLSRENDHNSLRAAVRERMLHHHQLTQSYPPRTLVNMPTGQAAQKVIRGILRNVQNDIEKNNGVSEKDVLKLFLPLGVPLTFFDNAWLRSLNDLARARGEVAHDSWNVATATQLPTPQGERSRLVAPLLGLRHLEAAVRDSL